MLQQILAHRGGQLADDQLEIYFIGSAGLEGQV